MWKQAISRFCIQVSSFLGNPSGTLTLGYVFLQCRKLHTKLIGAGSGWVCRVPPFRLGYVALFLSSPFARTFWLKRAPGHRQTCQDKGTRRGFKPCSCQHICPHLQHFIHLALKFLHLANKFDAVHIICCTRPADLILFAAFSAPGRPRPQLARSPWPQVPGGPKCQIPGPRSQAPGTQFPISVAGGGAGALELTTFSECM